MINSETERIVDFSEESAANEAVLRSQAAELAQSLSWLPSENSSRAFVERCRHLSKVLKPLLRRLDVPLPGSPVSDDSRWLHDNVYLIISEFEGASETLKLRRKTPHVRTPSGTVVPRVAVLAEGYLGATAYQFTEKTFASYVEAFQEQTVLNTKELWALVPVLKLVLLEQIAVRGSQLIANLSGTYDVGVCVRSLRDVAQASWKDILEPLILPDHILREDPAGAYARMDLDSRDLYRSQLVDIAERADVSEIQVAQEVVALARQAQKQKQADPRVSQRCSHVGYYLLAEGTTLLHRRVGFRPTFYQRISALLRRYPDEFYLTTIQLITLAVMSGIVLLLIESQYSPELVLFSMLALFLPCSQAAVQLTNYLITALLQPQILPKLDLSEGIPDDCVTFVAVPSLLLNDSQVRKLVDDLEVRFLGNHDQNIHFALLTDLPDSRSEPREDDPLVDLSSELITGLNEKYAGRGMGSFLLFHRHRVYNPREEVWMGWERKRGKLMDLNRLLRNQYDSFPIKVGDLSVLSRVRFVITLDSDTELPRGSAQRMVGALAHPLNQAIIDPEKNIVVAGYGILQPRVGVSVQSTARSRLANIYSGETGFDIYTRAISDLYQDLYGEGIFAGKGIYEVDTVRQVLDRRFPRNALLSHDLIEGAYARAGLASDIEVIESYPSHYSAYNRRKHRWLRGDWQIAGWLLPRVPDESGQRVPNPISITAQWKILDNLRRSLVEPATLLLFVLGWVVLPGSPVYWTLATLAILFVPTWCQFVFELIRAAIKEKSEIARDAVDALFAANINVFLTLTFLAHQMLLSLDAVVRTLVRRIVTRQRLLQWETAAEAENGASSRTTLDTYLDWTPALALGLGILVWFVRPRALPAALPILLLWASSKWLSLWLNRPPRALRAEVPDKDELLLRRAALRTWRYFDEFSTEEHNWLLPDNVQEEPPAIAARISPTNLGLLLNARQVACEFGYLTVPEFALQTKRTLATISKLQRYRGHLLNWYDTRTLTPLEPELVSAVDSGNLVASLWTLQQGCLDLLSRPILQSCISDGFRDHLRILVDLHAFPRRTLAAFQKDIKKEKWLQYLLNISDTVLLASREESSQSKHSRDAQWFAQQARARLERVERTVSSYAPWLLPKFAPLWEKLAINSNSAPDLPALDRVPSFIDNLAVRLRFVMRSAEGVGEQLALYQHLEALLPEARANAVRLIEDLHTIAVNAAKLANEMDFRFLLNRRKLLSVGFDVKTQKVHSACYDLLATESRTAVFTAIAKDDIRQESWFMLGRAHTLDQGRPVLLSWTGTMFEYLMPLIWMRTYPNTLLERSARGAIRSQQAYVASRHIPWGISESAHFRMDEAGNYQYYAFGIPSLALSNHELNALVISPYSTFLALHVCAADALKNLHRMSRDGWLGAYGFYESADFSASRHHSKRYELVRCWMAHHQGMSLLSIANYLLNGVVQRWFHSDPRVQATELLLHEKPVARVRTTRAGYGASAA
ncbi:MAG: glucoamylase family protein [Terriglobales bacterium]